MAARGSADAENRDDDTKRESFSSSTYSMEQETDMEEQLREMDRQEKRFREGTEEDGYCWPSEASSRGEPCDFEQCLWDAADLIQKLREHGFEGIVQHIGSFFAGLAMRDVSIPQALQRERSPDRLGR